MTQAALDAVNAATAKNRSERYQDFSIELDCAPGGIRPSDLIEGVLKDSGLTAKDFTTSPPFFGHQVWILKEGSKERDELFRAHKYETFKPRITSLYNEGYIRYGTW